MTQKRAARIISILRENKFHDEAMELFMYFTDVLDISDTKSFATLCGYPIAVNVEIID